MPNAAADQDEAKFRVDSRVEIAYILRSLAKSGAPVTAYYNGDREFVVTVVLSVDAERGVVILDAGAKDDANQRLLRSRDLSMVSTQDGIKVQFASDGAQATTFEGRPALRIAFPRSLLKLQRREYYRMPTPVLHPIKCEVPAASGTRVELAVADISLGGACLVGEVSGVALEVGTLIEGCRIQLPDAAVLAADMVVRNSYLVTLKNGQKSRRTGCEFLRLGAQQEAALQRYIIRLERDRRANTPGARG
jgi:c-di-GMP-binding flagellar brake protein YcgR